MAGSSPDPDPLGAPAEDGSRQTSAKLGAGPGLTGAGDAIAGGVIGAVAIGAVVIGAVVIGAVVIGAVAIGAAAIGAAAIGAAAIGAAAIGVGAIGAAALAGAGWTLFVALVIGTGGGSICTSGVSRVGGNGGSVGVPDFDASGASTAPTIGGSDAIDSTAPARVASMKSTSVWLRSSSGTNASSIPDGWRGSPASACTRVTVPLPAMSCSPFDRWRLKRTRVPGGCGDLVKMKMRSPSRWRE